MPPWTVTLIETWGEPRKRWRDVVKADLRNAVIDEDQWFDRANSSRARWHAVYRDILKVERGRTTTPFTTHLLSRVQEVFYERRRQKGGTSAQQSDRNQVGVAQYRVCNRWFQSHSLSALKDCLEWKKFQFSVNFRCIF